MHIRGGSIVPTMDLASTALNILELRKSEITLVVALDTSGNANGNMILDDGASLTSIEDGKYTEVTYTWSRISTSQYIFTVSSKQGYTRADGEWPGISALKLYGATGKATSVTNNSLNAVAFISTFDKSTGVATITFTSAISVDEAADFTVQF
jgi:hypothetical protein